MLKDLPTEQRNSAAARLDELTAREILRLMNAEDHSVAPAVAKALDPLAAAVEAIVARMENGGRLFYVGAGTSGRLGVLDAAECPPTFGVDSETVQAVLAGGDDAFQSAREAAEDDAESGRRELLRRGVQSRDAVVGISASGRTPFVLGAIQAARDRGALTVGVACVASSALAAAVDFPVCVETGPEIIAGSTRLKAATATKMVLNMISTAVMVRLGCTYGDLMVNVRPKNLKLAERAARIVSEIGRVPLDQARKLLEQAGGEVKVAAVMARLDLAPAEAAARVSSARGRLREALCESKPPTSQPVLSSSSSGSTHGKTHNPGFLALVDEAKARIRQIDTEGYRKLMESGTAFLLIDTREESEWAAGHAAGAIHLCKGIIERDIETVVPDKHRTIVLYCGGGYRSALAAENLQRMGYTNVFSLDGGWRAWQAAGLPVEK